MTEAVKDLDYYAANPDEMPTGEAELAALMARMAGEPAAETQTEQAEAESAEEGDEAESAEKDQEESKQESEQKAEQDKESEQETEAPIASADGKHAIPYAVLRTEREKRKAAEQAMQQLQDRIAKLESGIQSGEAAGEPDTELETLAGDFPAVAKLMAQTKKLEDRLQDIAGRVERDEQSRQEAEAAQVRAAVDSNPVLLHWEHNDPERWAAAVEADSKLQNSPAHRHLTMAQRFEKAVAVVNAFYGDDATAPKAAPIETKNPAKAAAKSEPARPRTLSDIPGGAIPATDPLEEYNAMSVADLSARMTGMSPDQIASLLNRLG